MAEPQDELIDAIDWAALSHAYGYAMDTPLHLRALASPDAAVRERARRELSISVIHQGTHWEGAPEATRCLVAIVLQPGASERPELLELVRYLATGFEEHDHRSVDALAGVDAADATLWRGSYEAVASRLAEFVPLLGHAEPAVRAQTATLLGFVPDRGDISRAPLLIALRDEDPVVAGSAAVALGALGRRGAIDPPLEALVARLAADSPRTRAGDGAALALAWLGRVADASVVARLASILAEDAADDAPLLPFHRDLGLVALELFAPHGPHTPEWLEEAVTASLDSRLDADHYTLMARLEVLIEKRFPKAADGRALLYEELRPRELAWLRVLVTAEGLANGNVGAFMDGRGLPSQVTELRLFLGLDPETLLHSRRLFRHPDGVPRYWPTWRWLYELSHRDDPPEIGATELARVFSAREIVTLIQRHLFALRLSWDLGGQDGHLALALRLRLGSEKLPLIDPPYGEWPMWKTEPRVRDAMLDLWVAAQEGRDLEDADAWIAACLVHAPPAQPWLADLLEALPASRRERLVITALRTSPAEDLREASEPDRPAIRAAPWLYLRHASSVSATSSLFALIDRVNPWDLPLVELLTHLGSLPADVLDAATTAHPASEGVRETVRRARWLRDGGIPDEEALRWELRQWFRDGATLGSGEDRHSLMAPCALCAHVFRELRIHPQGLGGGARGGVVESLAASPDTPREMAFLRSHWQEPFFGVTVGANEAWADADEDPAIARAIDSAIAAHPDFPTEDRRCVELRVLSRFAAKLRAAYRAPLPASIEVVGAPPPRPS